MVGRVRVLTVPLPECPRAALGVALDRPEPGYFALRLGSRKPWTPAVIFLPCPFILPDDPFDGSQEDWFTPLGRAPGPLRATVGETAVEDQRMIVIIWQGARAVSQGEYGWLTRRRAWARRHQPDSYHAQPADLRILRNRDLLG